MPNTVAHEKFTSRFGFLMAAIGAAVGLGNLWKFPYMLGENGGGAFMLIYLLAMITIATPVMMAEMLIGRTGRMSAPNTMKTLAQQIGASKYWQGLGWLGIFGIFLVLSYFSVIGGWSLAYMIDIGSGSFNGLAAAEVGARFGSFLNNPKTLIIYHCLFMVVTVIFVARGIQSGIEKAVKWMMPALFLMLLGFTIYGFVEGNYTKALTFMFHVDFSKITPDVALTAVGQAFFSVNVGIGALLTYAAYLPNETNLPRAAIMIAIGDTAFAILAGLAIFPIVFAYGLNPQEGAGLVFVTLSAAFAQMPAGQFIGALFFFLVFVAALTSALSMLETIVSRAEEIPGRSRKGMTMLIGAAALIVGLVSLFSFNIWQDVHLLDFIPSFADKSPFALIDYLVSSIILPVGTVGYALFAGWWMSRTAVMETLGLSPGWKFNLWLFLTRYVAPIGVLTVFWFNLF